MLLENRGDDAWKRQPRTVESVDEARLPALSGFVANIPTPCLEIGEVAARRHLEPLADPWRVRFQIIGVRAGKACVAGCKPDHPIRELEQLQNFFGVSGQQLE